MTIEGKPRKGRHTEDRRSMSSIKGDVEKKAPPRPEVEKLHWHEDSAHTRFRQFSTTCKPRNQTEISSPAQEPCERLSSELAPSHPSRRSLK